MTADQPRGAPSIPSSLASWLAAWLAVGLATVVAFESMVPRQAGKTLTRFAAHADGLALHIALALVCTAVLDGARRWVPRDRLRVLFLLALACIAGALLAEEDLRGFAELIPGPIILWSSLLGALGGAGVVVAHEVGRRTAARLPTRVAACLMALAVAGGHHAVLQSGYEGIHFVVTANAAALLAGVLGATPAFLTRTKLASRARLVVSIVTAVVGAVGFGAVSSGDIVLTARRLPGHAVVALASRARQIVRSSGARADSDSPWLRDRSADPPTPPSKPRLLPKNAIVVLVTIDATRAELMRSPGIDRFPNLKRLSEESLVFTHARSAAPHTTPSLSTLMLGKYYSQIRWTYGKAKQPKPYEDKSTTIAEAVTARGAKSAAYVALGQISEEYGLGRGFSEPAKRKKNASEILAAVNKRVKKGADKGLFVYAHVLEPHSPYAAKGKTEFDRYLGELDKVDEAIGPLVDTILSPELAKRAVLIVTSDHGEAFGEHNSTQHGTTLYEELQRIPMIVHIPGVAPGVSTAPVSLIDIGPTVMDLLDAPVPSSFMGQSLLPLISGKSETLTRPLLMESGRMMRALVEDGRYKYIQDARHGTTELYDLEKDPTESENLVGQDPVRAARLQSFIDAFFDNHMYRADGYQLPYYP